MGAIIKEKDVHNHCGKSTDLPLWSYLIYTTSRKVFLVPQFKKYKWRNWELAKLNYLPTITEPVGVDGNVHPNRQISEYKVFVFIHACLQPYSYYQLESQQKEYKPFPKTRERLSWALFIHLHSHYSTITRADNCGSPLYTFAISMLRF